VRLGASRLFAVRVPQPRFARLSAGFLLFCCSCVLLISPVFPRQNPDAMDPDQNKAKARQVLKQSVEAMGGPLFRDQTLSECDGRVAQFDRNGGTLGYSMVHSYWQYPDKNRSEYIVKTTKGGIFAVLWGNLPVKGGEFIQLFDGDKGWTMDKSGVNEADATVIEEFQAGLKRQIRNLLLHRASEEGVFLYYAGIGISDMREVEWIDFTDNDDRKVRVAIDRLTHLPLRTIATTPNEDMHDKDEDLTIYSNYEPLQGVQTPMQISREHNGRRTHQIFYTSCTNAPNVPADFFTEASLQKKFKDTGGKVKAQK
jgi:hypothetical protein